jgi:hypothetical protein
MTTPKWNVKSDVFRPTTDFADCMAVVAATYQLYTKTVNVLSPYIARQNSSGMPFMPMEKEELKTLLGKPRNAIDTLSYFSFVDAACKFLIEHKGRRAPITPNPSSHHSAQFVAGTFEIAKVEQVLLRDSNNARRPAKTLHAVRFAGVADPVFIENLSVDPASIKHIILRPKLGKLGMPSTNRWEVLMYSARTGFIIDHTDSELNPRWSGRL